MIGLITLTTDFCEKKIKCLSSVDCCSMPSVAVAVLTGLITIFKKKKSRVICLCTEHSGSCSLPCVAAVALITLTTVFCEKKIKCLYTVDCCSMPSFAVAVPNGLITIFRNKKSQVICLSTEHSSGLVALLIITLVI